MIRQYILLALFIPFILEGLHPSSPYYNYTDPYVITDMPSEPSPRFCCEERLAPFISAEYLYWTAREDGLKFAFSGTNEITAPSSFHGCGKVFDPDFEWNSGFKVGAGLIFLCSGWDVYINYTRLKTDSDDDAEETECSHLFKYWETVSIFPTRLLEAEGDWKLKFNVIDVELGNEYFFDKYFSFRPYFGIKGTWQKQEYNVEYIGTDITTYFLDQHQCFWGLGPRGGFTTTLHFNDCYKLFGNVSLTGLWGNFDNKRKDSIQLIASQQSLVPPITLLCIKNHCHQVVPVFEFSIGAEFDTYLCKCGPPFTFKVAWEHQVWLKQNQYIHISRDNNDSHGHLNLQGVTATALVEF